ncbi:MAG: Gfo/Idh/MocA family oxidoreductase [Saprospiraceae bacterium]|nr:Gfo/Idh/MocA family oxidoreductase [Saprospiraceae bacterium]
MHRRQFNDLLAGAGLSYLAHPLYSSEMEKIKIGVIGLDTSHAIAFSKIINQPPDGQDSGFIVTHAYPQGSRDIESSVSRIPGYIEDIKKLGVSITDSIKSLLDEVDAVLLETNDGRLHLEQATEVFESGKIVFIDKPIAASLEDTVAIFKTAEKHEVPVFSASSLRYSPSTQEVANGKIGDILGADTYSPAKLEKTHPDLFWYGIHGVEALYTVMGKGCKQVRRIFRDNMEVVVGEWENGRIGTFRGIRSEKGGYGGVAFGTEGIAPVGQYEGYQHLVVEILKFFKTGVVPIDPQETVEIFAFMTAADQSRKENGAAVSLASVM